ncbi:MAG TPA: homogentisate 1,2-dioxygenase [Acidimicrobiales bacterium]|nr:homogentisate 1,2-dioxygenase [Acidimicrobiales bacterium]
MAPSYHRLGDVPRKRHVAHRAPDGELYDEEVVGLEGFSGRYSILYHRYAPTRVLRIAEASLPVPTEAPSATTLRHHLLRTAGRLGAPAADELAGRHVLLWNDDVRLAVSSFAAGEGRLVRNGGADELHFVFEGGGRLESLFGVLEYRAGDYVCVPKGTTHRWVASGSATATHLVIETPGAVRLPRRYQNAEGQLLEHAPYWERDFRRPIELCAHDERGEFDVWVRVGDRVAIYTLDHDPLDVVAWDGHLYPYAFSIHDFEPVSGRQHQPPPVHQTFELDGAVICSFVPRRLDDGPDVITAPYNHANLDSDEVLFYVSGNFFSRRGIEPGALSWHPRGIPHGPAPGVAEKSIGATTTSELAVMVDTFRPLRLAAAAEPLDDPSYPTSWLPTD